jgi:signal transduction histidine kinase
MSLHVKAASKVKAGKVAKSGMNEELDQLRQENAALKEQLAHAQRLVAIGELASTTAHEFNNVLMTILNYAKMGLRHKDEATRDKALDKIFTAAQRAAKITSTVLGAAKNRSGEFEPTDLTQLVDDALVLLERELQKYRIRLERQFQLAPPIWAIGNQIQQVLLNLLTNARQAMPSGGTLLIKIGQDAGTGMVELTVRDTGCGIAADKLPHIFDPFFTTKSGPDATGKGGTGLGLSACRTIIEAHRGRIRVESTVGKGTAFIIRLPVAKTAPVVATESATLATTPAVPQP